MLHYSTQGHIGPCVSVSLHPSEEVLLSFGWDGSTIIHQLQKVVPVTTKKRTKKKKSRPLEDKEVKFF